MPGGLLLRFLDVLQEAEERVGIGLPRIGFQGAEVIYVEKLIVIATNTVISAKPIRLRT